MYIEAQLMDQFFAGVSKWCIVCVSLVAWHIICGHTNYYITVSQPVVKGSVQWKNDLGLYCSLVLVMNIGMCDLVIFCLG